MSKVVGIGACVMDTLFTVPQYPAEDTKLRATDSRLSGGGPVSTGLVAVSKLGESAGYIGQLSDDTGGRFLQADFEKYGVATDTVRHRVGFRSFCSVIWLSEAQASRTCVFDKGSLPPLSLDAQQLEAVCSAEVLMLDGNDLEAALQAARTARENNVKVLYDAGGRYEGVEQLLPYADLLIPSREFALGVTGCKTAETAAKQLYETYHPSVVVITCGAAGGVLFDGELYRYPSYPAQVVDSNGAGDVFHGAFAVGVTKGYSFRQCCHFASAVSALKCTGIGARESVPSFSETVNFLKENGYDI